MALGQRLKLAREHKGLTQAQVERLSGLSQANISALEQRDSSDQGVFLRLPQETQTEGRSPTDHE